MTQAMTIDELYLLLLESRAENSLYRDILAHLPILREYAGKVDSVLELGVRSGISTGALLAGKPKRMVSVDIEPFPLETQYREMALAVGTDWRFLQHDSRIPVGFDRKVLDFGLIFFDTRHTREQLSEELAVHARHAKRFLIFHDTVRFWNEGQDGEPGLREPIEGLLGNGWKTVHVSRQDNGLMVLERA